jgi:hypothetical protein
VKKILWSSLLCVGVFLQAGIFEEIEIMQKGADGYILGKALNDEQKEIREQKGVKSDNPHVGKFLANENLLIAYNTQNNRVLAINKRLNKVTQVQLQTLISNLIHDYDEPTAMAHDKMIYWIYNAKGEKLDGEDLKSFKQSLTNKNAEKTSLAEFMKKSTENNTTSDAPKSQFDPYLSIKLSSDTPIMEKKKPKEANLYLMFSSDKLITATTTQK